MANIKINKAVLLVSVFFFISFERNIFNLTFFSLHDLLDYTSTQRFSENKKHIRTGEISNTVKSKNFVTEL